MICGEYKLEEALGLLVFNRIKLGNTVLEKGHRLQEEDIVLLKKNKVKTIFAALMEDNDISLQTALGVVAAKLCGKNTAYSIGKDGICRITAVTEGIFAVNDERIAKFNRFNRNFILNIKEPYSFTHPDDIIAELELIQPVISQEETDELLFKLSGNVNMLSVHDVSAQKAGLIYSRFSDSADETKHFTAVVKKLVKDFPHMNMDFVHEYESRHSAEELANTLQRALKDEIDILFILPGQSGSYNKDIVLQALNSFVDEVVCPSLPQVGASDLIIASKRGKKVIVVPYNYDKIDSSYPVRYMKQAVVAEKLNSFDFAHPHNYFLTTDEQLSDKDKNGIITSANEELKPKEARIAAVVLAAGVGARAGRNKLLSEIGGEPLFLRALRAAVKSKASPVFLVTGHQADILEEFIEDIDVNVLYNPAYRSGIRTSISLGIKSVPGFCDGAMIIPADMPNLKPEHLNAMIKAFKKGNGRQLIISQSKGVRRNPVIWGKDLYDFADIVPENADLRPVFIEHSDYTRLVDFKKENEAFDVNYVSDIETMEKDEK